MERSINDTAADTSATTRVLKLGLGATPKVLLVDDDELVLARLRELITAAGFDTFTASSGSEALEFLEQSFAPIVITDLNMPTMGGLTLCRTIRQKSWPGYIYLILLTVRDDEADILAGLQAGADDYLSKRTSSAQLLARMRTAQRILTLEHSLKTAVAEKHRLAMSDPLTGAPNRRYFVRRLNRELKRANRVADDLSVMALDIDHFKAVNDKYGHATGDAVLRECVQRISECLPNDSDWYARIGGEEFAVVLGGRTLSDAALLADALRRAIALPIYTAAGPLSVTVSIGITGLEVSENRREISVELLCGHADQMLYVSKETGRNRVTLHRRDAGAVKAQQRPP